MHCSQLWNFKQIKPIKKTDLIFYESHQKKKISLFSKVISIQKKNI